MIIRSNAVIIGELGDIGAMHCPRCGRPYPVNPLFDHDFTNCLGCGAKLTEWNLMSRIYLIDYDRADPRLKKFVDLIEPLGEPEAEDVILALHKIMGVDLGYG